MKTNWQTKKIGEVFNLKPSKKEVREKLRSDDLVSFVPMENLGLLQKYCYPTNSRHLNEVINSYTYFSENDVLLAKITPCFENGKLGIAKKLTNSAGFGSSEYYVFRQKHIVDPEYLFYFLASDEFREKGKRVMSGAVGHKRVPRDFIENYLISFPESIKEQKGIVKKLDAIFKNIEKAKESTEKNLQNSRELFERYLENIFQDNKWKTISLYDVAEYFNGLTYSPKDVQEKGIIVLRSSNIQNDKLDFTDLVRVKHFVKEKLIIKEGDVLMCSRNGSKRLVGKTATITDLKEPMTFGTFMMIIRGKHNSFLSWFFKSNNFRRQISGGENTMINQITRYMLDEVLVPFPSEIEQKDIIKKLDELSEKTKRLEGNYQKRLDNLEELKKSILQKAFAGEL